MSDSLFKKAQKEEQAEYGDCFSTDNDYGINDIYEEIGWLENDDNPPGELEVALDGKKAAERQAQRWKEEYAELKEQASRLIKEKELKIRELQNKVDDYYIDIDKETLKAMFCEARLKVLNLEEELKYPSKFKKPPVYYVKGYVEKEEFEDYFEKMKNRLIGVLPQNYISALENITFLEEKIRCLEADNEILKEKADVAKVKNSERIKKGFSNVKKPKANADLIIALLEQGYTKTEVADRLKLSRQTIYNVLSRR